MWDKYEIYNFADVAKWLGRAKNQQKGRPLGGSFRMRRSLETGLGDTDPIHVVDWQEHRVLTLTSDDRVTLHHGQGHWPTQRMNVWLSLARRKHKLETHIWCDRTGDHVPYIGDTVFDIKSGRFITRPVELTKEVADDTKAREWKRAVTKFRKTCGVMARMGALTHIFEEAKKCTHLSAYAHDRRETFGFARTDDPGLLMYNAIKNNDPKLALRVHLAYDADYMLFYHLHNFAVHLGSPGMFGDPKRIHQMCLDSYTKRRDQVRSLAGVISIGRPK